MQNSELHLRIVDVMAHHYLDGLSIRCNNVCRPIVTQATIGGSSDKAPRAQRRTNKDVLWGAAPLLLPFSARRSMIHKGKLVWEMDVGSRMGDAHARLELNSPDPRCHHPLGSLPKIKALLSIPES